ncbi:hypothetical protein [Streptomyces sp. bgisy154]|uniref:hypothetical protein n=1 Tax=Streptomyces sp. bgisy154 TaxID=3413794 RepID=UPI003D757D99
MSKPDERLVEGVDYDHGDYGPTLGVDEPCGEGMCRCSCGDGCVCGCECPGDPDTQEPSACDNCDGEECACAIGHGARYDECTCGPTEESAA